MKGSKIIWVEGLIAVGKSTYAEKMAELLDFHVMEEPVDSNPYLKAFYKNPQKHAFGMQVYLLTQRYAMKQIAGMEAARGYYKGLILDRSMLGDFTFAKLNFKKGNISDLDWQCYLLLFKILAQQVLPPTLLVYLDCDPEIAFERMKIRDRTAESAVELSYLEELQEGYENLISDIERGDIPWCHSVKVVRMDWNQAMEKDNPRWRFSANTLKNICERQP
jgi:deoxyadenosine/deoxycytidine kinase